jgi:hypothetical protein
MRARKVQWVEGGCKEGKCFLLIVKVADDEGWTGQQQNAGVESLELLRPRPSARPSNHLS